MNRIVPHQVSYSWLKYTGAISTICLYVSATISLILLFMEIFQFKSENCTEFLNRFLALISFGYFVNEFCQSCIFNKAESQRNLDFIDNSFNTKFAEKKSTGYYSNDEVQAGIIKMGVNGFENSFFSKKISAEMLNKELRKFIVVTLLFLTCIFTSPKIVVVIVQMSLPLAIIQQTIKLYMYNCKVNEIFFNYKAIFSSPNPNEMTPHIIKNCINYEKLLSWASIPLDDTLFNQMNDRLSIEWNDLKKDI